MASYLITHFLDDSYLINQFNHTIKSVFPDSILSDDYSVMIKTDLDFDRMDQYLYSVLGSKNRYLLVSIKEDYFSNYKVQLPNTP